MGSSRSSSSAATTRWGRERRVEGQLGEAAAAVWSACTLADSQYRQRTTVARSTWLQPYVETQEAPAQQQQQQLRQQSCAALPMRAEAPAAVAVQALMPAAAPPLRPRASACSLQVLPWT